MTWIPERNGFRCTEHDQLFARGRCCPHPGCAEAAQDDDAPLSVFADGMLTVAEYEGDFAGDAKVQRALALRFVSAANDLLDAGNHELAISCANTAFKGFDGTTKAGRAGVENARWREDWKNVRLLRDLLARVKRERAELAQERRADESKDARH